MLKPVKAVGFITFYVFEKEHKVVHNQCHFVEKTSKEKALYLFDKLYSFMFQCNGIEKRSYDNCTRLGQNKLMQAMSMRQGVSFGEPFGAFLQ